MTRGNVHFRTGAVARKRKVETLKPGQVICGHCRRAVSVNESGSLRVHRIDLRYPETCPNRDPARSART